MSGPVVGEDDISRLMEEVRSELQRTYISSPEDESSAASCKEPPLTPQRPRRREATNADQQVSGLRRRLEQLEEQCAEAEEANQKLLSQQQQDGVEIVTLRKVRSWHTHDD